MSFQGQKTNHCTALHWTFSLASKVFAEFTLLDIKVARDGNPNPSKFNPWSHRSLVHGSMHLSGKFAKDSRFKLLG